MSMYEALNSLNTQVSEQVCRHCMAVMDENYFVRISESISELGEYTMRYRFFKSGVRGEEILVDIRILGNAPVLLTIEDLNAGSNQTYIVNKGNSILQTMAFFDSYVEQLRARYGVQYLPGYEQGGELTASNFCDVIRNVMQIMLPTSKYVHTTTLTIEQLLEDFTREQQKGATFFEFSLIFNAGSVLSFKALSKASDLEMTNGYVMANDVLVVHGTGVDLLVPGTEVTIYVLMPDFENDIGSDLFK